MKPVALRPAVLGMLVLLGAGCTRHVAVPDLGIEATQRVLLVFRGGEEVEGRIAAGNRVILREPGRVYSARIDAVTEERVVLKELILVREQTGVTLQVARAEQARVVATEIHPEKTLLRGDIVRVDRIQMDVAKTARRGSFWVYGAAVLALLLGERS